MRQHLLGYILDALEPDEREHLEQHLRGDSQLQRDLELLHDSLDPVRHWDGEFAPPPRLAVNTLKLIDDHGRRARAPLPIGEPHAGSNRWSLADLTVAAGIFIAGAMLFFPAIQHSRVSARLAGCQNNLRQLGVALTQYSDLNHKYFPDVPAEGALAGAGVYAVKLADQGLLDDPQQLLCPATEQARNAEAFRIPTVEQLQAANGAELEKLHRTMGGSYGYSLGYRNEQGCQTTKNQHRPTYALMADAPTVEATSSNHDGCGQNVLYEDGHVKHLSDCVAKGCRDHIFLNDEGQMAAGVHPDDAVIGHSAATPILKTLFQPTGK